MAVNNGQKANAENFNSAFVSRTANSDTTGVVGLKNTSNPNSGPAVNNVQRAINEIFDAVGMVGEGDTNRKSYDSTNYIANGDDRRQAISKLDKALHDLSVNVRSVGGDINYIFNPGADANIDGWEVFANETPGAEPESGTGGEPDVTLQRFEPSSFRGLANFLFSKPASDCQGQGISYPFTIDNIDRISVRKIRVSFEFSVFGDYAHGDLKVFIYDVTNETLVPFFSDTNGEIPKQNAAVFSGHFFPNIDSSDYRFIVMCATASTDAFIFEFDNVHVGPVLDEGADAGVKQSVVNNDTAEIAGLTLNASLFYYYRIQMMVRRSNTSEFRRSVYTIEAFYNDETQEWILSTEERRPLSFNPAGLTFTIDDTDPTASPISYTSDDMPDSDEGAYLIWNVEKRFVIDKVSA